MQSGNASAYYDLGNYRRAVSTSSNASQTWFERGLNWCYGYHHEESMRCFRRAAEQDPNCAMAYWGLAYGAGPNYNKPWEAFLDEERAVALGTARDAVLRALEVRAHASPVETALIEALEQRYPVGPEALDEGASGPFADWNDAYAAASASPTTPTWPRCSRKRSSTVRRGSCGTSPRASRRQERTRTRPWWCWRRPSRRAKTPIFRRTPACSTC